MSELYGNYSELRQKYEQLQEDMFDADLAHDVLKACYEKLLQKYEERGGMLRKCRKEKEEMRKKYNEIYEHGQGLEIHNI